MFRNFLTLFTIFFGLKLICLCTSTILVFIILYQLIVTLFKIIREAFKTVYKVALLLLIVGVLTTGIDYTRNIF